MSLTHEEPHKAAQDALMGKEHRSAGSCVEGEIDGGDDRGQRW